MTLSFADVGVNNGQGTLIDDVQLKYTSQINRPPTAADDYFELFNDSSTQAHVGDLLVNDHDVESDTITFVSFETQPTHGQLSLDTDGNWVYSPYSQYVGTDQFKYKITDGTNESVGTVYFVVFASGKPSGQLVGTLPQSTAGPIYVPDAETVYIRRNGDDDNGDLIRDLAPIPTENENDLIQVSLRLSKLASEIIADGYSITLKRSSSALQFWNTATKDGDAKFTEGDVIQILTPPDSNTYGMFAEWTTLDKEVTSATLELWFEKAGDTFLADKITFRPFNSIVIGYVGEFQTVGDKSKGMNQIVSQLYLQGYDAFVFDEDDIVNDVDIKGALVAIGIPIGLVGGAAPPATSLFTVKNAVLNQGVTDVALLGYSHGAGAAYILSQRLAAELPAGSFQLKFTAYIDGVKKQSIEALDVKPVGSLKHYNIYQSSPAADAGLYWVQGTSIEGSFFDDDTDLPGGEFQFIPELTHGADDTVLMWVLTPEGYKLREFSTGIAEQRVIQDHLIGMLKASIVP